MRILHVSLGLPPWRTGGLTNYSLAIMNEQQEQGHEVSLIYPGKFAVGNTRIKQNHSKDGKSVFEIINPLPVSILYGMKQPNLFMKSCTPKVYKSFFDKYEFDVIHIHTIMGIHKEFFEAAKAKGIRTVFTTHDYYGLCLTTNLLNTQDKVCEEPCGANCAVCCYNNGLDYKSIVVMQSKIYRMLKNSIILKKAKSKKKAEISKKADVDIDSLDSDTIKQYDKLLDYYKKIFSIIDYYHYNSSVTKEIFSGMIGGEGRIVPITLDGIIDNRKYKEKKKPNGRLNIGYIGTKSPYKGYSLMEKVMNKCKDDTSIQFHLYGGDFAVEESRDNVYCHGSYSIDEIKMVYSNIDILVVPSLWKETFALVGLEALSFGVPIIVSENVGIKDIVNSIDGTCVIGQDHNQLYSLIRAYSTDIDKYNDLVQKVKNADINFDIGAHVKNIRGLYVG